MDTANYTSLSDLLSDMECFSGSWNQRNTSRQSEQRSLQGAEAEWRAAIAALTDVLPHLPRRTSRTAHPADLAKGLILSGPLPVLSDATLDQRLEKWVITPQPIADALQGQKTLLPSSSECPVAVNVGEALQVIPLSHDDPLLTERFCLVITPAFSVGLVLGQPTGASPRLQYSFDPQTLLSLWQQIQIHVSRAGALSSLDALDERITKTIAAPDYRAIAQFTQALLAHLPHRTDEGWPSEASSAQGSEFRIPDSNSHVRFAAATALDGNTETPAEKDTELLQAMAHEIRTPLTTIRTLTRSLLRRKDLAAEVKKRLARIDQECTQQIDRFNLIFRAVELETAERNHPRSSLTPIALTQIFQDAIPRWQQQAQRRNLNLDVTLPPNLPRVTSDPTLLNEVLAGVVEWFTQCLPPHSHVHMTVMLAGHQLKLQFESENGASGCPLENGFASKRQSVKSVGQLLTIVPETGGVSLNLDVTKSLFQFLGGKLILRQKPEQGDVLTAFLPLDTREI
ncbi:HAMP domain-containing sensor histidine kinase [Oscillatoria sp. CS-180]|uniref:sensor histidine kinase n=1 Tax=Oscillatoria sp. CS-180 TaxID=3021720 RepID=UPI00232AC580|nr:HAMP domain-containing sensor histidine kinase [Oscillatoria sp. CS-180]MDB9526898.1 HAMP domain-containing sensor histidine kinase [Oscillatoria sp. CS-180]